MIFFKNEMCCVSNESRSYEITLTVLFLMPVLCSCVLGALLGGDLGNSNGACPSPVRKSSHTVTHPAPFCFPVFQLHLFKKGNDFGTHRQSDSRILYVWQQAVTCARLGTQSRTRAGKHLLTGDSWRSQYKLLVNSPKTRMGFRLSERNGRREFEKKPREHYRRKKKKLLSCICVVSRNATWKPEVWQHCGAGLMSQLFQITLKWAQRFVPVTCCANTTEIQFNVCHRFSFLTQNFNVEMNLLSRRPITSIYVQTLKNKSIPEFCFVVQ